MSDQFRPLPVVEAIDLFGLSGKLESFTEPSALCGTLLVHEGDLRIDREFRLEGAPWAPHAGLVVTGSLVIEGDLVNWHRGAGPYLCVLGSLQAQNIIAGGSEIYVEGHAFVRGIILAHSKHGFLTVRGITSAKFIASDHHKLRIRSGSSHWRSEDTGAGFPLSDQLHSDIRVSSEPASGGLHREVVAVSELLERHRSGMPVLRASHDARPRKSYSKWLEEVRISGDILRHVPRRLIDERLALSAVMAMPSALQWVPPHLRTMEVCATAVDRDAKTFRHCPLPIRSDESFATAAVKRQGRNLKYVASNLRSWRLCLAAVKCDPLAIAFVPERFLTAELCSNAVHADPAALALIPPKHRSVDLCIQAMQRSAWALWDIPPQVRGEVSRRLRIMTREEASRSFQQRWSDRLRRVLRRLTEGLPPSAPSVATNSGEWKL